MSYILDALKKIEHEKINKRSDGRISIAGTLFSEQKQPAARVVPWKIVLLIVAASLITSAGTWFILKGGSEKSTAVIRPVKAPTAAPANIPAVAPVIAVLQPTNIAVSQKGTTSVEDNEPSRRDVQRSKIKTKTQPVTPKQPVQTVQPPADIKLSGIAWQDERTARRAVINGFLLKEGAIVSGAKVIDIRADRVRFSTPAGLFEIKLDAVLPTEVK
jgi:general secretion pathway protein B